MIVLRPDQEEFTENIREALRRVRRVCACAPTGFGKRVVISNMMKQAALKGKRAVFGCHRRELIKQASDTFNQLGIAHGVISPGWYPQPYEPIQIASIDTLGSRLRRGKPMPRADLYAPDECHHSVSQSWTRVEDYYSDAFIVGSTATPERPDGRGLITNFDELVVGPSMRWLIDNGHLAEYRAFAPSTPDVSGVHTVAGDFDKKELEAATDDPKIIGDAVAHYLKLAPGKKFMARHISVNKSILLANAFRSAGIPCWHVDGTTDAGERDMAMDDFRRGDLLGLVYVDLLGEGTDVADAEVFVDLCPTKSLTKALQGWGRVMRYVIGKTALLLDHGGNLERHGLPDDHREWSLLGRKARKKAEKESGETVQTRQCPACFFVLRPAPKCPSCGHIFEAQPREVEERAGELVEIDKALVRQERLREQGSATTLEQLIAVGKARGYRNPMAWAEYVWNARQKRRA